MTKHGVTLRVIDSKQDNGDETMIKLIPYFDTNEGNTLADKLFALRKEYLPKQLLDADSKVLFDGTQVKGYIAEITLHTTKEITPADSDAIKEVYSFFVG